jgi:hypothetical protein
MHPPVCAEHSEQTRSLSRSLERMATNAVSCSLLCTGVLRNSAVDITMTFYSYWGTVLCMCCCAGRPAWYSFMSTLVSLLCETCPACAVMCCSLQRLW